MTAWACCRHSPRCCHGARPPARLWAPAPGPGGTTCGSGTPNSQLQQSARRPTAPEGADSGAWGQRGGQRGLAGSTKVAQSTIQSRSRTAATGKLMASVSDLTAALSDKGYKIQ